MKLKIAIFLLILPVITYGMQPQPVQPTAKSLVAAIHKSDIPQIRQILLANPLSVNADATMPVAPLREAALGGNLEIINALLDAGSPADPADSYDITPLMMAALNGHIDAVKLLISRGANVNAKDKSNQSVLNYVQFGGATNAAQKAELTRILIEAGAR